MKLKNLDVLQKGKLVTADFNNANLVNIKIMKNLYTYQHDDENRVEEII